MGALIGGMSAAASHSISYVRVRHRHAQSPDKRLSRTGRYEMPKLLKDQRKSKKPSNDAVYRPWPVLPTALQLMNELSQSSFGMA